MPRTGRARPVANVIAHTMKRKHDAAPDHPTWTCDSSVLVGAAGIRGIRGIRAACSSWSRQKMSKLGSKIFEGVAATTVAVGVAAIKYRWESASRARVLVAMHRRSTFRRAGIAGTVYPALWRDQTRIAGMPFQSAAAASAAPANMPVVKSASIGASRQSRTDRPCVRNTLRYTPCGWG